MIIFIVQEHGDDYHGSRSVKAYDSKDKAIAAAKELEENQKPCKDCGHKYWYTVSEVAFESENIK